MAQPTDADIRALITNEEVRGSQVQVTFRCPVSGKEFTSSASAQMGAGSRTRSAVTRSLFSQMRWGLARMVGNLVGGGQAGYMVRSLAHSAMPTGGAASKPSEAEVAEAVLDAFRRVSSQFAWDASTGRYVASSLMKAMQTPFTQLIESRQITERYEKQIMARMLAEIAGADGTIAEEERALFEAFAQGSLEATLDQPPLTKAELGEVETNLREVLWGLACAIAHADESLDVAEAERLTHFAAGLRISPRRTEELKQMAREHILDQLLDGVYADGRADSVEREKIMSMAISLGIDREALDRLDVRCRRRKGLA